jgi:hypothetical protein
MSHARPTLEDLRSTAQKRDHRVIGNWLARSFARPLAIYGTWAAVRLGLSAHQVTLAALAASLAGAVGIGTGQRLGFALGAVLLHLGFWLDHVDGQVARWRRTASLDGVYLDYLMHHIVNLAVGISLGYGLAARTVDLRWALAGVAIAAGWSLLALHNDCRYKAFFQRLKSGSGSYRVESGSGGRPSPPARWPRHGAAALVWPAYKLCEPHTVLTGVTILAALAILSPSVWFECWRASVLAMCLMAPVLGAARIARAATKGAVEAEFSLWFRASPDSSRERPSDCMRTIPGSKAAPSSPSTAPWTAPLPAMYDRADENLERRGRMPGC